LDEADFGVIIRILCGEPGPWRFATVITVALSRARVTAHFFAKKRILVFVFRVFRIVITISWM